MASTFSALSRYLLIINLSHSQLNEYEMDTGDDGSDIWRSTSDFVPIQDAGDESNLFGNITIGELMDMEFDFVWGGYTNEPYSTGNQFENFFRVGFSHNSGSHCEGHGSRYPSFWINPSGSEGPYMHVSVSYDGACQAQDPPQTLKDFGTVNIGESYHILISTNLTFTTVTASSNDNPSTPQIYPFARASATEPDHIGLTANVYFMSGKFGSS